MVGRRHRSCLGRTRHIRVSFDVSLPLIHMLLVGVPTAFFWMTWAFPRLLLAAGQGAHLPDVFFSTRLAPSKSSHFISRGECYKQSFCWCSVDDLGAFEAHTCETVDGTRSFPCSLA
jgi:hypothetical protein